jgi:hypothetical protein
MMNRVHDRGQSGSCDGMKGSKQFREMLSGENICALGSIPSMLFDYLSRMLWKNRRDLPIRNRFGFYIQLAIRCYAMEVLLRAHIVFH